MMNAPPADGDPPWLDQGEPLLISAQMRKMACASRRFPKPVPVLTPVQAWQRVRQRVGRLHFILAHTDAPLRAAARRAQERMAADAPPPDADADALLLASVLPHACQGECAQGVALVDYLVARYGLLRALDIWLAAHRVQTRTPDGSATGACCFSTHVNSAMYGLTCNGPFGQPEEALRRYLAAADEDEWNACAARIEAALPSLHCTRQPAQAMLLPERPELSDALALALNDNPEMHPILHWLLLTSSTPVGQAVLAVLHLDDSFPRLWQRPHLVATCVLERGVEAVIVLGPGAEEDPANAALTAIGTPMAVRLLAKTATTGKDAAVRTSALARLTLSARRWPLAALVTLARFLAAPQQQAAPLLPLFCGLLRAHRDEIKRLRPWLDTDSKDLIEHQLAQLSGPPEPDGCRQRPCTPQ